VSKIEVGRYSELLRRSLGMKGVVSVAEELSPEVSPTIELEAATQEWSFLKQVREVGAAGGHSPGAGLPATFRLINPAGSGVLAVVTRIETANDTAGDSIIRMVTPAQVALAIAEQTGVRDTRWETTGTQVSPLTLTSGSTAPFGGFLLSSVRIGPNQFHVYDVPLMLAPDSSVDFGTSTINVVIRCSVAWHERGIQPLEL